ncbi:MAG: DNA-directed RNA polymerase subunit beta' [Clostridia bacterium]|nr:DNA-directed RNA polymerase subunit beta' [Clostridia bacterium]
MFELNNFDAIQIGVASPEKIRSWSYGEVTKPETINYRTQKPERDGLFCERIFGPTKDWECHCGKYKRSRYQGVICDKCGVEVTRAKVRRERMGHIELAAPVSHIWYFRGVPSRIGIILDMAPRNLEAVLYFASFVVLDPGETELTYKQVLNDKEYREAEERFGKNSFKVGMGAEAIKELLMAVDLDKEAEEINKVIATTNSAQKRAKAVKRIDIIEAFRKSGNRPEWMILDVIPVIPPELRPMVALEGGRFATSDLNDLYRRVINRNNRLKKMLEYGAPDIIVRNEKRMLQEAVDALIDNGRRGKAVSGAGNRDLRSLSGMLKGKQGRFRQNLLGKRVDYSGRSVIVVGPELKIYQCGLPKEMAIELFKPFVIKKLIENGYCQNVKSAKRMVERMKPVVWDILEGVIKDHPVLLNRAPTLHRLSIQAFEPVLIEGRAIKLHPMVCGAFNADFDGDQMAVHVPLSIEAQAEARFLMLSSNNILKLADGKPVMGPTHDMVLGCYYLTIVRREHGKKYDAEHNPSEDGEEYRAGIYTPEDAVMAYQTKQLSLQDEIFCRRTVTAPDGTKVTGIIKTTTGRIIFNEAIPQNLGMCERNCPEDYVKLEINALVKQKTFKEITRRCFKINGAPKTAEMLDNIKAMGYKYSTISGLTTSVFDMKVPAAKAGMLEEGDRKVGDITGYYEMGLITDEERHRKVCDVWESVTKDILKELEASMETFNPIKMMMDSGARGSKTQLQQLAGMRGLMADPSGKTIEIPIKASFREGLSVLEYFVSSHGGRKGLADTALKTADSGYLTRRLVDVSHNVIIREDDCHAGGMYVEAITEGEDKVIEPLEDRIIGRYTVDEVVDPATGEVIVPADTMISEEQAEQIVKAGITRVNIRTAFTCKSRNGVCAKCYGKNMSNNLPVNIGEAVGIIAAQSIGEPGTQLTMRTFHSGGVASAGDITQGLPRVEELFECRRPKGQAIVCETSGVVSIEERDGLRHVIVENNDASSEKVKNDYIIPFSAALLVKDGDSVEPGTVLTSGSVYPQDILRTKGFKGVQEYILTEVQKVYRSQGVDINDKHIEIIVRQMLRKVQVENCGDTTMLPGELVDITRYEDENRKVMEEGGRPATVKRTLLPITKASLATESFLSAASFQETAKVLTEAAIKNKIDPLLGLKENVIIGKLIPAGTGLREYKQLNAQTKTI